MATLSRRELARLGAAAAAWSFTPGGRAWGRGLEPAPDFGLDGEARLIAGIRPYRDGSFRLEAEMLGDRLVVHDYGHGGAGITLSWGSAHEVLALVRERVQGGGVEPGARVAVLGAGVMGLTAATLLLEAGFAVTVYARGFCEETTSHVAGGQFAPSAVAWDGSAAGTERFQRMLRASFREHESRIGRGFGVVRRRNYTWTRTRSFEVIPRDVVPEPEAFARLPFVGHEARPGFCYQTLLIEPPVFLRRLELDLRLAGVRLIRKDLASLDEALALDADVLVNCLGLGAGAFCGDAAVVPVRGQLVLLKPQPRLEYLYGGNGYIFPRSDAVVVGGSFERGVDDATPDPAMCAEILAQARAPFAGDWEMRRAAPAWLSPF